MRNLFIGRKNELKRLASAIDKKSASFIVIKGRRRIGKSRLIDEFSQRFDHYYKFEGIAPEEGVTASHQLEEFCRQMSREFNSPPAQYSDWSDVFWALGEQVQTGKILLFFDEISWMGHDSSTFLAKLKVFWDNRLVKNARLVFVVCSSASSWLEKNLLSSTGFVGRVSFTLTLKELPLFDCDAFWPIGISAYEKFKVLSVTGGIPKYLEEINPKISAEENIKQLCFTEGALLVNEFDRIFSDLFLRESKFYEKIVTILATGVRDRIEIEAELSKEKDYKQYGRISEYLWELEEAGFIRRDYTWNIATAEDSKLSKYRLQDNYLRFYLKYIKKNLGKIKRNAFSMKSLTSLSQWDTIMGFQFENMVINSRDAIFKILGIDPNDVVNDNPFFQRKTERNSGCQIDYMIQTKYNTLYICEIKFHKHTINASIIEEVQAKIACLKYPKGYSYRPVLIHVNGISEEVIDSDYFTKVIDLSDLLQKRD